MAGVSPDWGLAQVFAAARLSPGKFDRLFEAELLSPDGDLPLLFAAGDLPDEGLALPFGDAGIK